MRRRRYKKTKGKLGTPAPGGKVFKSRYEHKVWHSLPKKKRNFKAEYEPERIIYVTQRKYVPDLKFTRSDGSVFYVELKGYLRPEDRTKMIAVKSFNPDLDIRILFAQDNLIKKGSKTKYSDWARKNGFPFAFGTKVPVEWLNGSD